MQKQKKSQAWYMDFILGFTIFVLFTFITIHYLTDEYILPREESDSVLAATRHISDSLVSSGSPDNWTSDNVVRIGLTNGNHVINETKLESFLNLTTENYISTRAMLGTRFDYLVFFKDKFNNTLNLTGLGSLYYGKPGLSEESVLLLNPDTLYSIERNLVLKKGENNTAQIIIMHVYVWQ
ncbi:MAG: hypothetical protein V1859_01260 [archaeon]